MQDRKLSFHGEAGSFTSPCFFPEVAGSRIVIDSMFFASLVEDRSRRAPERLARPSWHKTAGALSSICLTISISHRSERLGLSLETSGGAIEPEQTSSRQKENADAFHRS